MWTTDTSARCKKQQSTGTMAVSETGLAVTAPAASSKGMSVPSRAQTSSPALSKLLHSCNAHVLARVWKEFTQPQRAEFMLASLAQHMTLSCSASCSSAVSGAIPAATPALHSPVVLTPRVGSTEGTAKRRGMTVARLRASLCCKTQGNAETLKLTLNEVVEWVRRDVKPWQQRVNLLCLPGGPDVCLWILTLKTRSRM